MPANRVPPSNTFSLYSHTLVGNLIIPLLRNRKRRPHIFSVGLFPINRPHRLESKNFILAQRKLRVQNLICRRRTVANDERAVHRLRSLDVALVRDADALGFDVRETGCELVRSCLFGRIFCEAETVVEDAGRAVFAGGEIETDVLDIDVFTDIVGKGYFELFELGLAGRGVQGLDCNFTGRCWRFEIFAVREGKAMVFHPFGCWIERWWFGEYIGEEHYYYDQSYTVDLLVLGSGVRRDCLHCKDGRHTRKDGRHGKVSCTR